MGKRVMAIAHPLHYGLGLTQRKVPAVLRTLTGVKISQSAITQDALRRARGEVGDAYRRLRSSARQARSSTPTTRAGVWAETLPFLMAFETDEATVYQVRPRHRNEEVRELIPSDYGGVMVDGQRPEL